ncbi:hypothetical protein AN948_00315 [Rhodococcus sp. ADH]|nr:hypothetical protein AN948_00315 [Rhodococcus sp. ADH]RGP43373.1 hypothetical protein AWH04_19235 [Rhodococcus erythropolis]
MRFSKTPATPFMYAARLSITQPTSLKELWSTSGIKKCPSIHLPRQTSWSAEMALAPAALTADGCESFNNRPHGLTVLA